MISQPKHFKLFSVFLALVLTLVWSLPGHMIFAFQRHSRQIPYTAPLNPYAEAGLNGNDMEYAFITTTQWTALGAHIPSGNSLMRVNLFEIPGAGIDMSFGITYNSVYKSQNLGLGKGWISDLHTKATLDPNSGNVTYLTPTGAQLDFMFDPGANKYSNPMGFAGQLKVHGNGTISFTDLDKNTMHFDSNGNLASIASCDGGTLDIDYNQDGQPVTMTDPISHRSITLQWDQDGLLETVSDPLNHTWRFQYDAQLDQLVSIEQPRLEEDDPATTHFEYNQSNQLILQTTFEENFIHIRYHDSGYAEGKVAEWEDAQGNITAFNYEGPDQQYAGKTILTSANSLSTEYYMGAVSGQIETIKETAENETQQQQFTYTPNGWIASVIDTADNVYQFTYNDAGRMTSVQYPPPAPGQPAYAQQWEYDDPGIDGKLVMYHEKITPTLWATTQYLYQDPSSDCYPSSMVHPDGSISTASYNQLSQPLSMTNDPNQLQQTIQKTYSSNGNLSSTLDPEGNETTYQHDSNGRVQLKTVFEGPSVMTQVQKIYAYSYHFSGRLTTTHESISNVSIGQTFDLDGSMQCEDGYEYCGMCYLYNPYGEEEENPYPILPPEYRRPDDSRYIPDDPRNPVIITPYPPFRLPATVIEDSNGTNTYIEHDSIGNKISQTNTLGQTTQYAYDHFNRLSTIEDFDGKTTTLTYDSLGKIATRAVSGQGNRTYTRDALGRVTQINDPVKGILQYSYNIRGNMIADEKGTYSYDIMGRRVSAQYYGGGSDHWSYRSDGTLSSYNGINYQHNLLGLLTQWSDGTHQATIQYRSSLGLPTAIIGQNHLSSYVFEYNNHAQPLRVQDTSKQVGEFFYSWGSSNQLEILTNPGQVQDIKSYQFGKISSMSVKKDNAVYYSSSSSFNQYGQQTSLSYSQMPFSKQEYTFGYNSLQQLENIEYENQSRLIEYAYDQQSGLISNIEFSDLGIFSIQRHANGKIFNVQRPSHQGSEEYSYHSSGQLESVELPGQSTLNFSWDAQGRITQMKTMDGFSQTIHNFNHNSLGLLTGTSKNQDGITMENWHYAYGPAGLERAARLVMGVEDLVLNFSRDLQGMCLSITYQQLGGYQGEIIPHYDQRGHLVTMTDLQGNMLASFQYDLITGKIANEWNPQQITLPFHGPSSAVQIDLPFSAMAHSFTLPSDRQWSLQMDWGTVTPQHRSGKHPIEPGAEYEEFLSWDCRCDGWSEGEGELKERDREAIERELRRRGIRGQRNIDEITDEIEKDINNCCTSETHDGEGGFKSGDAATLVFGTGRQFEKWIQCKLFPEEDGKGEG